MDSSRPATPTSATSLRKATCVCLIDEEGAEKLSGSSHGSVDELSRMVDALHAFEQLSGADDNKLSVCLHEVRNQLRIQQGRRSKDHGHSDQKYTFVARFMGCGLPVKLVTNLRCLEFEDRKVAAHILSDFLAGGGLTEDLVAEYVQSTPQLTQRLFEGCADQDLFFLGSQIARAAMRNGPLVSALVQDGFLQRLLDLCFHQGFEISNEAFALLRDLLLGQKSLAAKYIEAGFEEFFVLYHPLLQRAEDYVVQRQALNLLGQLLLDRAFQRVMLKYVQNEHFLQIHMMLLTDRSQTIPLEAFHIFKLFAANPTKPRPVQTILSRNARRLIKLLDGFRHRLGDDAFEQDLAAVLDVLACISA